MKALCESCHHLRPHPRRSKTPVLSLVAKNRNFFGFFIKPSILGRFGEEATELWAPQFLLSRQVFLILPFTEGWKFTFFWARKLLCYIDSSSSWPEFCAESLGCLILMCKCTCIEKNILIRLVFDIQGHCLYCEFEKQEARRKVPKRNTVAIISEFHPVIA